MDNSALVIYARALSDRNDEICFINKRTLKFRVLEVPNNRRGSSGVDAAAGKYRGSRRRQIMEMKASNKESCQIQSLIGRRRSGFRQGQYHRESV